MGTPNQTDTTTAGIDAMIKRAEAAGNDALVASLGKVRAKHLDHLRLMDRIVVAFTPPPGKHRAPDIADDIERTRIDLLATMIEHIRAENGRSFYFDEKTYKLREAIRTIGRLLPGRVALAERELTEAKSRGENSDLDHTIRLLRALDDAAAPLTPWAQRKLHRCSAKWHLPARTLALDVGIVLGRQGITPGFSNAEAPGVEIVRRLLRLAGIKVELETITDVLSGKPPPGKNS